MKISVKRHVLLLVTGLILGLFFIIHVKSFEHLSQLAIRDVSSNIFREIQILNTTNKTLTQEVSDLEKVLTETKDRSLALNALEKEIQQDQLLDGSMPVTGAGITVSMPNGTTMPWFVDLVNELWSTSAEAVSINGIRLTNDTVGLDALPQDRIMLNGTVLQPPYIFQGIGDSSTLYRILIQPGGFVKRFQQQHKNKSIAVGKSEKIVMEKIL